MVQDGPLLLQFGVDIPISPDDYVGKNGYYTFQVTANCLNNLYPAQTSPAQGSNVPTTTYNPAS